MGRIRSGSRTVSDVATGTVTYQIRYREVGTTEWTTRTVNTTGSIREATELGTSIQFPTAGEYETQIRLVSVDAGTTDTSGTFTQITAPIIKEIKTTVDNVPSIVAPSNVIDQLAFGITFPRGIFVANDSGGLSQHSITVQLEYRAVGSDTWIGKSYTVSGSTTQAIRRLYPFKRLPEGQYEMRAYITSSLRNNTRYGEDTFLEYVQYGIADNFRYSGVALLGITALATDQLSGNLPQVSLEIVKTIVPVKINGVWEEFDLTNPAWAAYDLIVRPYYLDNGDVLVKGQDPDSVDIEEFREWARWCNINDYTFNMYIDQAVTLAAALNMVSACGRGHVFQKGSTWGVLVDRPSSPVMTFGMGNIIKGSFSQQFSSIEDLSNVIEVQYFERDSDYSRQSVEVRSETFDTEVEVVRKETITLYGCVNRQQAIKYARSIINQNTYLRRVISFEAHLDSIGATIGDVISVPHDVPQWGFSGRIVSASSTSVVLDREVPVKASGNNKFQVRNSETDELVLRDVVTPASDTETSVLNVTSDFGFVPQLHAVWSFGQNSPGKLFRIIAITRAQELTRRITALEYRDEVYDDNAVIPDFPNESALSPVSNLNLAEEWVLGFDATPTSNLVASWDGDATGYYVFYRGLGEELKEWEFTKNKKAVITGLTVGNAYEVCVSATQNADQGISSTLTLQGKAALPNDVDNFFASFFQDNIRFSWDHIPDIDLWGYEIREGVSWETGTTILRLEQKNAGTWHPPFDATYRFHIRAIDTSNNYSPNSTSTQITVDVEDELNVVYDEDETQLAALDFGSLDNMVQCPANGSIIYLPGFIPDDCPDLVDTYPQWADYTGTGELVGRYTSQVKDIGNIISAELRMAHSDVSFLHGDNITDLTFPERTDLTYPNDTDIMITSEVQITQSIRTSEDNVTFTEWQVYNEPIRTSFRYYQFRWEVRVDTPVNNFKFTALRGVVDVPERTWRIFNRSISSTGTTFNLATENINANFVYVVNVSVLGSSPVYPVVTKQSTEFIVRLFDSSGNATAGTVDIEVRGY